MTKKNLFILFIILFFILVNCSVLSRPASAEPYMPSRREQIKNSLKNAINFIIENSSDWIQDYTIPRTISDIRANRKKRIQIIKDIRASMIILY